MGYTLKQFCADCHAALKTDPGRAGREAVRAALERLLAEPDFIARHVEGVAQGKRELYRDPELGFLVLAHGTAAGNRRGRPHDHGASWAVYGQARGFTEMTVWKRIDDGAVPGRAELVPERRFRLEAGRAALFDTGTIHNTAHPEPALWVRVTGADLDRIERHAYDPEAQTVRHFASA